jgi:DNA-directed RNA polymerase specialized sigma24 family protein
MKAEAIYQSIRGITKFSLDKVNDAGQKSSSFSYLTQIITNAFRQILKKEKKNREIKDQAIELALNEHSDVEVDFESIKRKKERLEMTSNS